MTSDFSRTLALLRKEKRISQRVAAADLDVSQALLSHYENGLREPGLSFVVHAADYYGVSCDYLLGRSMSRDGAAPVPERAEKPVEQDRPTPVQDAMTLLLQLASDLKSTQLQSEIEEYLSVVIYKIYRYLYLADPSAVDAVFRTRRDQFDTLCDACMKLHELRLRAASRGEGGFGLSIEQLHAFPISPNELSSRYPELAGSLLQILQQVSDALTALDTDMNNSFGKNKKTY